MSSASICPSFKNFVIEKLFDIHPTKSYKMTNNDLFSTAGKTPVVVNSSRNNGIGGYVDLEPTESGNVITFSDTVDDNAIFYQDQPFIGYSHVQGMYPLEPEKWNRESMLYFLAAFKKTSSSYGFSYGNKFTRKAALKMDVELPARKAWHPDWTDIKELSLSLFARRLGGSHE